MSAASHGARLKVAYVVKTYPRLSETFILNEILEMERRGVDITILALKRPAEPRFHEKLACVAADVLYAPDVRSSAVIDFLSSRFPRIQDRTAPISQWFWEALGRSDRDALEALIPAIAFMGPLRDRGIEHLHAHFATSATTTAQCLSRLLGIGYSFTAHAKDLFHESVELSALTRKVAGAEFVVAISQWSANWLVQSTGSAALGKVHQVYNGIDLAEFFGSGTSGWHNPHQVCSVGRLVPKKGFPTLVEAVALLKKQGVPVRVEIAGEGETRPILEEMIRRLDVADRVILKGALSHGEIRKLLASSSVFALPAEVAPDGNRDGLPVVIVEAMATGIPVISTPVVGIPEAIVDDVTGLLVPERDPVALAAAIRKVLEEKETAARLVEAARRHVEERFDLRVSAEALHRLMQKAVAERNGSGAEAPAGAKAPSGGEVPAEAETPAGAAPLPPAAAASVAEVSP